MKNRVFWVHLPSSPWLSYRSRVHIASAASPSSPTADAGAEEKNKSRLRKWNPVSYNLPFLTHSFLPRWLHGLRLCHWLLAISHHCPGSNSVYVIKQYQYNRSYMIIYFSHSILVFGIVSGIVSSTSTSTNPLCTLPWVLSRFPVNYFAK